MPSRTFGICSHCDCDGGMGTNGIQWVEPRDAAKCLLMHRMNPTTKNRPAQMSKEPVIRTPVVEYDPISILQIAYLSPVILRTQTLIEIRTHTT